MKIEKGIPMPQPVRITGVTEAFRKMKIGESIVIKKAQVLGSYASAKNAGIKISLRTISKDKARIWRIK